MGPVFNSAAEAGCGLMLDAMVWRAHADFIAKVGRSVDDLAAINARAVRLAREAADRWRRAHGHDQQSLPVLVVGDLGPRGDGYQVQDADVTAEAARDYHRSQIAALADAGADLICALTMTTVAESIGVVEASGACGLPVIVSPTVGTDGCLPGGVSLGDAIGQIDEATGAAPLFYMVNCAHPDHLLPVLEDAKARGEDWLSRFRGFRANASTKSHEELDNSADLDRGDIADLGVKMAQMRTDYALRVVGGCCGTDHEHLRAMVGG